MGFVTNLLFQVLGPNQEINPIILIVNINIPVLRTMGIQKNTSSSSYAEICMIDSTRQLPVVSVKTTKMRLRVCIVEPILNIISSLVVKISAQNRCQTKADVF